MRFKVMRPIAGKTVEISCQSVRQENTSKFVEALTKFKFDCYWPGQPRWQWIHKEEEDFHGVSDVRSYSIPVTPICANDYVEISITWISLMGVASMPSVEWRPLQFTALP
jgi:hypothetical protein